MKEVWKPLPKFEELYEVSNIGRVKGLKRRVTQSNGRRMTYPESIKKQHTHREGYKYVSITGNGVKTKKGVHRLVAKAFIPNPHDYPQVNHKDGNKGNNLVNNLEWCTPSMNTYHAYENGLASNSGENNGAAKLTWEKVYEIRKLYKTGNYLYKDLGEKFGVSGEQISLIVKRKAWKED